MEHPAWAQSRPRPSPEGYRVTRFAPLNVTATLPKYLQEITTTRCWDLPIRAVHVAKADEGPASSTTRYGYPAKVSLLECLNVRDVDGWGKNVACDLHPPRHRTQPALFLKHPWREYIGDCFAALRDAEWVLCPIDLVEQR